MPAMAIPGIHIPLIPTRTRSTPTPTMVGFWLRQSRSDSAAVGGGMVDGAVGDGVAEVGGGVAVAVLGTTDGNQGFADGIPSLCMGMCIAAPGFCTATCTVTWPAFAKVKVRGNVSP